MRKLKGVIVLLGFFVMLFAAPASHAKEVLIGFTGPLSGPAAEYGQDCFNGIEMAVNAINSAGGFKVSGVPHTFKLERMDDRIDPVQTVNNARRLRSNGAVAVFNPAFITISALLKVNEEKNNEFLVMGYTTSPRAVQIPNSLRLIITTTLLSYVYPEAEMAWAQGARSAGLLVTVGGYGDEWKGAFKAYWEKKGGVITLDKPANYYTETDFSSQLTAIMATKPDIIVAGGPTAPTALVIEQARNMGFKGNFVLMEQAKPEIIASILKDVKLMEGTIGVAPPSMIDVPASKTFGKSYSASYKRPYTYDVLTNYGAVHALAKAMTIAGTATDVHAIRAAFPKAFPQTGDKFVLENYGLTEKGRFMQTSRVTMVKNGKFTVPQEFFWWQKTQQEFEKDKKLAKSNNKKVWIKIED